MSPQSEKKPNINRSILSDHKIFFYEDVCTEKALPRSIRPIRARLLRMSMKITKESHRKFKKECSRYKISRQERNESWQGWSLCPCADDIDPLYIEEKSFLPNGPEAILQTELEECEKIRDQARNKERVNAIEKGWENILEDIFQEFSTGDGYADDVEKAFRGWEVHQDVLWSEHPNWEDCTLEVNQRRIPKPDFTYAFPIVDADKRDMKNHKFDSHIFSLRRLTELRNRKTDPLISAPTTALKNRSSGKPVGLRDAHLMCFPWAIVELKPNKIWLEERGWVGKSEKEFSYCQAANASAAALTLQERLRMQSGDSLTHSPNPVIIAFTCVGPNIRLWLTYRVHEKVKMRCIWASTLQLSWGVFELRMIVRNMHQWIRDVVRPNVSHWIDLVRGPPVIKYSHTPDHSPVTSGRRALSCDPPDRTPVFTSSPNRTSRPPTVRHGKTAPVPTYSGTNDRFRKDQSNGINDEDSEEDSDVQDERYEIYYSDDQLEHGELKSITKMNRRWYPQGDKSVPESSDSEEVDDGDDNDDDEDDGENDYCDEVPDEQPMTPRRIIPPRVCVSAKKNNELLVYQDPRGKIRRRSSKF